MNYQNKRLIIICEGPTEKEFCTDVLQPWFSRKNIIIQSPLIKKSGGGIIPWKSLKKQIENHLRQDHYAFVTMLIDYYGIEKKHLFPAWDDSLRIQNKSERMTYLETAMANEIEDSFRNRFIPNILLHEFEGLLFSSLQVFTDNFKPDEFTNFKEFSAIFKQHPNPEDINDGSTSAPSKRLEQYIPEYKKVIYGAILASETGLPKMREKCPRFNEWINKIENY